MINTAASTLLICGTSSVDIVDREVDLFSLNLCFIESLYFGTLFSLPIWIKVKRVVLGIRMKHLA